MIVEDFLCPPAEIKMTEEPLVVRNILISYFSDGQVCVAFPITQSHESVIDVLQASIRAVENLPVPVIH